MSCFLPHAKLYTSRIKTRQPEAEDVSLRMRRRKVRGQANGFTFLSPWGWWLDNDTSLVRIKGAQSRERRPCLPGLMPFRDELSLCRNKATEWMHMSEEGAKWRKHASILLPSTLPCPFLHNIWDSKYEGVLRKEQKTNVNPRGFIAPRITRKMSKSNMREIIPGSKTDM